MAPPRQCDGYSHRGSTTAPLSACPYDATEIRGPVAFCTWHTKIADGLITDVLHGQTLQPVAWKPPRPATEEEPDQLGVLLREWDLQHAGS